MTADVIAQARAEQRTLLSEVEAKELLAQAGLNVTETRLATSIDEAAAHAAELGYPVALKVVSHKITHKTDVGGVELGVADEEALRDACRRIHERVIAAVPEPEAQGVSVQPMAEPGVEVILGLTQDQQFGPVLMFGLGGVFVEVLKDVAFRIVPLEPSDAAEMVREIQGFPILEGVRGQPAANLDAIESMLLQLSEFADAHPEIAELDLNPVFAQPDGAIAVDARILLAPEA